MGTEYTLSSVRIVEKAGKGYWTLVQYHRRDLFNEWGDLRRRDGSSIYHEPRSVPETGRTGFNFQDMAHQAREF